MSTYPGYETMPPPNKTNWKAIIAVLAGAFLFVVMCLVGVAMFGGNRPVAKDPVIPAYETSPSGQARTGSYPPPTLSAPLTITGKNNSVGPIGNTLNGRYKVDYKFSSWCGIAKFLKADGSDGSELFEMVNDCAGDINAKASGSTIVNLTNVTLLKIENTSGAWSITFTPITG